MGALFASVSPLPLRSFLLARLQIVLSQRNLSLCVQRYGDEISAGKGTHYPNPNHNNDNCMKLMGFSEISLSLTFIVPITAANS